MSTETIEQPVIKVETKPSPAAKPSQPQVWFTSDTHFGHANIIKYCDRPFASTEEMDAAIIANWNKYIKPEDTVFHLGDVSWGGSDHIARVMGQLAGHKTLIIGNHDNRRALAPYFEQIHDYYVYRPSNKEEIILMHYPIASWHRSHHGMIHLHGHTHGTFNNAGLRRFDVGVDCWDMEPISLAQIKALVVQRDLERKLMEKPSETVARTTPRPGSEAKEFNKLNLMADLDFLGDKVSKLKQVLNEIPGL